MKEDMFYNLLKNCNFKFHPNAYVFVLESLHFTQKYFKEPRHVTGQQLLKGIALLAKEKFGDMAWLVFQEWGIQQSIDFGTIVFQMVEIGEIKKTEDDRLEDFDFGFDLEKELNEFQVKNKRMLRFRG